jgi:hypothetical protein
MRSLIVLTAILVCFFQGFAGQSTVSGFAVAARNVGGGPEGMGRIIKYNIRNGLTTDTATIFKNSARYATINPNGQRMAFVAAAHKSYFDGDWTYGYRIPAGIVTMSTSGGAVDTVVQGVADAYRTFLDWPTGDWLFYGVGSTSTNSAYDSMGLNSGVKEIWKVNVTTKAKVKICSFTTVNSAPVNLYQFAVSNDGTKCAVRPISSAVNTNVTEGMLAFQFADYPGGVVNLVRGSSIDYSWYGCGVSMSPSGQKVMHINNGQHTQIVIGDFSPHTYGNDPTGGTTGTSVWVRDMSAWRAPGSPLFVDTIAGGGTDCNRWSSNSDKWFCVCVGWRGRNADGGCNQVLVNYVDHEVVRTSMDTMNTSGVAGCNETGDFWLGNATTTIAPRNVQPDVSAGKALTQNVSRTVYDMLGRQVLNSAPLKRGVYFVQVRDMSSGIVKTQKLVIKK